MTTRAKMTGRCQCRVCRLTRAVVAIQRRVSRRERAVLETLLLEWEAASTDATYYRMRLHGTWPTAVSEPQDARNGTGR